MQVLSDLKRSRAILSAGYCLFDGDGKSEYTSKATEDFRLIYVARGSLKFIKNGEETLCVDSGTLTLLTPFSRDYTVCSSDCRDYWVSFSGFEETLRELSLPTDTTVSKQCEQDTNLIHNYFDEIITELQLKERGYAVAAESRILKLLLYLARDNSHGKLSSHSHIKRLAPALLIMNNELNVTYPMEHYAKSCNMSKSSFLHLFPKIMHTTPIKYINGIRMQSARTLLAETTIPISAIAESLGFSSAKYFSKTFKAYCKLSPREYREQAK